MPISIDEIKKLLAESGPLKYAGSPIAGGVLHSPGGGVVDYSLLLGWDIGIANVCDETWGVFNVRLMRFIRDQQYEPKELQKVLSEIQVDDSHWRWLDKSCFYHSDEYTWFFVVAEGYPQAACLTYHPKPSALDGKPIFYIEYVAVAPWNRRNPMCDRSFKGVGPTLIEQVCGYANEKFGTRPGFSLHALPKAVGFYQKIGMENVVAMDKPPLTYFEMPENGCASARLTK
jgi:hypothetical protein